MHDIERIGRRPDPMLEDFQETIASAQVLRENRALYTRIGCGEFDHRVVNGYPRVYMRKSLP